MSAFRFRLELPLRLARVRLGIERRELASVFRELRQAETDERESAGLIEELGREALQRGREGIRGAELHGLTEQRERERSRLPGLSRRRAELEQQQLEIQRRLHDVSREVKVFEKLRAEQWKQYQRDLSRREQARIDDVVLTRRAARRPGAAVEEVRQ